MRVTARVPATSANLGPGFDCLGVALELRTDITLELGGDGLELSGEGSDRLPRDGRHLVPRTIATFFERRGLAPPRARITVENRVPSTGGLGSSSAAIVGALLVANEAAGGPCSRDELLCIAVELEGHPDNVAPAMLGGLVVAAAEPGGGVTTQLVPVPDGIAPVIFVPSFGMRTKRARQLLPRLVPHRDAAFNASRTALFVAALAVNRPDLLRIAMQDKLHQPYRAQMFPAMGALFEAAIAAGAYGACLSGAGSALLAFAPESATAVVGEAMVATAAARGIDGRWLAPGIAREGAQVVVET